MVVVKSMYDAFAMVNEDPKVETNCSAWGPIVMLTVYGSTSKLQEFQKEVGYSYKYLNMDYASNPHSHGVVTCSNTNYMTLKGWYFEGLKVERGWEKIYKLLRNSYKEHGQK